MRPLMCGPVAVITNGPSKEQRLKLEATGLLDRFEVIAISGEVGHEKPAAEIFAHTLSSLGIAPEAALHIGDSLRYDVTGARAAGLTAVWLNRRGVDHDAAFAEPHHEVRGPRGVRGAAAVGRPTRAPRPIGRFRPRSDCSSQLPGHRNPRIRQIGAVGAGADGSIEMLAERRVMFADPRQRLANRPGHARSRAFRS